MKKKLMTLVAALGLSLAVLTGCGKPTVESLVDGMFDMESQTAEVEVDIDCSVSTQGFSVDAKAGADFEMQISGMNGKDALTSHADGKIALEVKAGGLDDEIPIESYLIVDDGTMTDYSYDDDDTWYMEELDDVWDQDAVDKMIEKLKDVLKENGELAEDTEKVEGEECYVITATIEGREWSTIFKPMKSMINDIMEENNTDFDAFSCLEYCSADITYYISKDTGYLVKIEIDASDTDLYSIVGQIMKDSGESIFGGDFEDVVEDVSLSKFYISAVFSDINDTEVEIPDDVIDDAVEKDGAGALDGFMGSIGDDPIGPDPDEPDLIEPDPTVTDPNGDEEHYTLNKCDASSEKLVDVCVSGPWSYDDVFSDDGVNMYLDHKNGGYIYISNEALEPLYTCAAAYYRGESIEPSDRELFEENGYLDYECDFEVIGSAFYGSDLILANESYIYDDGNTRSDEECTYLLIGYSDNGYIEFLTVDFYFMDIDGWTDKDFEDLARDLFGR